MNTTASSACSKGPAFISVTTPGARRAGGQCDTFGREAERDRGKRTWSNLSRRFPITAVELFPFMEATVHHYSILTIPQSIIPSRLWHPVLPSASALRQEVCALSATGNLQVNMVPWSLEASGSLPLPAVLTAPIRLDVVQQVHSTHTPDQESKDETLTMCCREHRQK